MSCNHHLESISSNNPQILPIVHLIWLLCKGACRFSLFFPVMASLRTVLSDSTAGIVNRLGCRVGVLLSAPEGQVCVQRRLLSAKQGVDGSIKLLPTLEEVKLHEERVAQKITSKILDQLASSSSATTYTDIVSIAHVFAS